MVPSAVVVLDGLPLNANGKVDRKALPAPDAAAGARGYAAPQGEVEQTLASIWSELLGVERVGRDDNFFDVGGHSLLLIKMHRHIETRLRSSASVIDLFKYPTVGAMAAFLRDGAAALPVAPRKDAEERAHRQRTTFIGRKPAAGRIAT